MTTKDDYQCTNVETPNCFMEEKIINDVPVPILSSSIVRGIRAPRMMVMVLRALSAQENQPKTATTSQERSKLRSAKLTCTGTVKNSRTSFPSLSKIKTRPKKAKKYSYTKDCKEQPREICDQCEKKSL